MHISHIRWNSSWSLSNWTNYIIMQNLDSQSVSPVRCCSATEQSPVKEDLKHLGYNVREIPETERRKHRLIHQNVFAESFGTVHVRTIIA